MLRDILFLNLLLCVIVIAKKKNGQSDDEGGFLVSALRNDANLDLPLDEEYEDLRAELLAYHTALASLTGEMGRKFAARPLRKPLKSTTESAENADTPLTAVGARRSMKTTPCWGLGGICVKKELCTIHRFLSEIPGCKNRLEVCCFSWNTFQLKDLQEHDINNPAFPWKISHPFGGKGLVKPNDDISDEGLKFLENLNVPYVPVFMQVRIDSMHKKPQARSKKSLIVVVDPKN